MRLPTWNTMSKQQVNIWISQEAAGALLELSAALNILNQRGEPSLSALAEHLGQTVIAAQDETTKLIDAAQAGVRLTYIIVLRYCSNGYIYLLYFRRS